MKTIEADTLVRVSISGRPQILTMPWHEAVTRFVTIAGADPKSVISTLQTGRAWSWSSGPGTTLAISLPHGGG